MMVDFCAVGQTAINPIAQVLLDHETKHVHYTLLFQVYGVENIITWFSDTAANWH